jgi:hypothetical protein
LPAVRTKRICSNGNSVLGQWSRIPEFTIFRPCRNLGPHATPCIPAWSNGASIVQRSPLGGEITLGPTFHLLCKHPLNGPHPEPAASEQSQAARCSRPQEGKSRLAVGPVHNIPRAFLWVRRERRMLPRWWPARASPRGGAVLPFSSRPRRRRVEYRENRTPPAGPLRPSRCCSHRPAWRYMGGAFKTSAGARLWDETEPCVRPGKRFGALADAVCSIACSEMTPAPFGLADRETTP